MHLIKLTLIPVYLDHSMLILKNISLINIGHICILYYYAAGHDRSDDELRQFPYLSRQPSVK